MKVKICGIRRTEDALYAIASGADAIGILVGTDTSADFIDRTLAASIVHALPSYCSSVLVTPIEDKEEIIFLARNIGVIAVQLQGKSQPEDLLFFKEACPDIQWIKTIHVTGPASMELARCYMDVVDALLLDTGNVCTGQLGGTGKIHDWSISREIVSFSRKPVILAGGLNPENVQSAIEIVHPFGVDVNSGVRGADGWKDKHKISAFICASKKEKPLRIGSGGDVT